jgi:RNA polymerase sigma-70 factor (ECF subfamily)
LSEQSVSDEALMSALAAGDMAALGCLVRRHQDRVVRLARRITGDAELADDIAQESFLRVHRAAKRYRPSARFTTWLHRIVVNLCWDLRRRWRPAATEPGDRPDDRRREPSEGLVRSELRTAVRRAVDALPPRQRVAVVLHRFEGCSMRDTAAITGWSESAVESCLVRAYRQLRARLAEFRGPSPQNEKKTAG